MRKHHVEVQSEAVVFEVCDRSSVERNRVLPKMLEEVAVQYDGFRPEVAAVDRVTYKSESLDEASIFHNDSGTTGNLIELDGEAATADADHLLGNGGDGAPRSAGHRQSQAPDPRRHGLPHVDLPAPETL